MKVNAINHQGTKNNQAFQGVKICRNELNNMKSLEAWVTKPGEDDLVELVDSSEGALSVGHFPEAKELVDMVRNIGQKITDSDNMKKVRELFGRIVGIEIIPEVKKERNYSNMVYNFENLMGGKTLLSDLKAVAGGGRPQLLSKDTYDVLSLELASNC